MGKISVIDRAVNPQTGAIRIRIVFPNPKHYLRAGMSFVVRVHNLDATPQLLIPNNAVVEEMGEYFVYIAKDSANANSGDAGSAQQAAKKGPGLYAYQTKVTLGATIGPNIIVKNGLKEGDKIVVEGVQSLHNGSQISLSDKRSGGSPKNGGAK
jgi:membrane fusion protein (multidrug efflux system)